MHERILVVAADFPYPPNHGGRVDVWKRMQSLKELGYTIDLLATVKTPLSQEEIKTVESVASSVTLVKRGPSIAGLAGLRPHQVSNRKELSCYPLQNDYHAALIEGSSCEAVLRNPTLRAKHVILRVHNDESLYFKKLGASAKNPVKALYYFIESARFSLNDFFLFRRLRHFLFISRDEYTRFIATHSDKHAIFLPPAITPTPSAKERARQRTGKRVLFIGSLFMPNNRDGIEWYMKEIHPRLRNIEGYKFVVAGNSKGTPLDWLTQGPYGNEIELHDSPPELDALYESAFLFVNPMRFGAGMKIKTIEAASRGIPMVSTTTGLEGTGLKDGVHLYQADTSLLFAKRIAEILSEPEKGIQLASCAVDFIEQEYDAKRKLEAFMSELA